MTPKRYILAVAGVLAAVIGIFLSVPAFYRDSLTAGIAAMFLVVAGLVILAISFGDGK